MPAAFESVSPEGEPLTFSIPDRKLPEGGHLQGVQMRRDAAGQRTIAYLSHDSQTVGYLLVVEFPLDLAGPGRLIHVQEFPSDGESPPLRHAGGMQLCEDILAVGLEDNQEKTRSQIQFWNVARPDRPRQLEHLTVLRTGPAKDKTSGAVALLRRSADHLLAVANWDSRAIDFYATNGKPLEDPECRFAFLNRWHNDTAEKSDWRPDPVCGSYQAIQLVADAQGRPYLLGFDTAFPSQDVVDLLAIDLEAPAPRLLQKIAQRRMTLSDEGHFRFGGGAWVDGARLQFLASERNLHPQSQLNLAR